MRQTAEWPIHPRKHRKMTNYDVYSWGGSNYHWGEREDPNEESEPVPVPPGLEVGDAYADRMWQWDYDKCKKAWEHLSNGFDSSDAELIAFAKEYFGVDVVAVRTVYYYNVSTGYDCPRLDYLYRKPKPNEKQS